ncbi:MAG: hypothetical protein LR011_07785 [Verrucomicrobia bacterium]|nr:hypothetical protein [Verrucomicrobiota bacterium]
MLMRCLAIPRIVVTLTLAAWAFGSAVGQQFTIPPPPGSGNRFGEIVHFLPNGNVVVIDTSYSFGANNVGAVHLYRGSDLSLISTLRGSSAGDSVGNLGITILANGHFVVSSQNWDDAENSRIDVGAVTWVHSELGLDGPVSRDNSLIGGSERDFVGRGGLNTGVVALTNGHYVVGSVFWKPRAAIPRLLEPSPGAMAQPVRPGSSRRQIPSPEAQQKIGSACRLPLLPTEIMWLVQYSGTIQKP